MLGTHCSLKGLLPERLQLCEAGEDTSLSFLASGPLTPGKGGKRPPWLTQDIKFAVSCWAAGAHWQTDADGSLPEVLESLIEKKGGEKSLRDLCAVQ